MSIEPKQTSIVNLFNMLSNNNNNNNNVTNFKRFLSFSDGGVFESMSKLWRKFISF